MKISSLNIRGLGAVIKKNKIWSLILAEKIDFMAIQETKMGMIDFSLCQQLWGNIDFYWRFTPACGNSGGILNIWNTDKYFLF